jgi:hypothetical protein
MPRGVEQQILDFLDGKTHGEELLHALHDHVLDEPIPERMLAFLRQACRSGSKSGARPTYSRSSLRLVGD